MTQLDDVPEAGALDLDLAAAQLRDQPGQLPVEVADRVLQRALATPRPAELVRAGASDEHLRVSTVALVALVHRRLDNGLAHAAVRRIRCDVARDELLEAITVDLVVEYGHRVQDVATKAHTLLRQTLQQTLGARGADVGSGPAGPRQHVHVGDVTVGDPHLVDPFDEQ